MQRHAVWKIHSSQPAMHFHAAAAALLAQSKNKGLGKLIPSAHSTSDSALGTRAAVAATRIAKERKRQRRKGVRERERERGWRERGRDDE